MSRRAARLGAGVAVLMAALAGFEAGRHSAVRSSGTSPAAGDRLAASEQAQRDRLAGNMLHGAVEKTEAREALPMEAAAQALRWSDDPVGLVTSVVEDMSRRELSLALAALTGKQPEELEKQRDLHGYARSMARAAMSGLLTEPDATPAEAIEFGTRLSEVAGDEPGQQQLDARTRRIVGVFPWDAVQESRIAAKWYRVDQPELLNFQELEVSGRDGEAFVRFDRPGGWPEGDYRLELYDPDANHRLIAAGSYVIRGSRGPRAVVFQ